MKMPFLMQVVLLGFISTTSCVFRLPVCPPGLPPAYLTNKPPLLFTDENDECEAEPDPPPSVADHFIAWQPRTPTSAASLQKPPSPGGQSGHATASNAIMKMPFLMQVVLLGFISTTSCVFRLPVSPPGLPPAYLTNKPPLLFTDENDECQAEPDPPPSVADHFIAWQPRTPTSAASLQKPPSPGGQRKLYKHRMMVGDAINYITLNSSRNVASNKNEIQNGFRLTVNTSTILNYLS
ncbi:hypothetical protein MRX96_058108 [Rhipicephalus microplus]